MEKVAQKKVNHKKSVSLYGDFNVKSFSFADVVSEIELCFFVEKNRIKNKAATTQAIAFT